MKTKLTDKDIAFLVATTDMRTGSKKRLTRENHEEINRLLDEHLERFLERILSLSDEEMILNISPRLLFEVLLRKAGRVLTRETYMLERVGREKVPVFDARSAGEFLSDRHRLSYMAELLASFTKIESVTLLLGVERGMWRKLRLNTMDIDSLISFCATIDEELRFPFYRRIADACLFILGVFPEYAKTGFDRYVRGRMRPDAPGVPKAAAEYEREGRKYYRLAAEHRAASEAGYDRILSQMAEHFDLARKPINLISESYLQFSRHRLFAWDA